MSYDAMKIWIDVAQFLITGAIGIYIYLINKNDATNRRIAKVEKDTDTRLDNHASRIAKLEGAIEVLPTHQDMNQLNNKVGSLARETSQQTGMLEGLTKQVALIQEWLYGKAK